MIFMAWVETIVCSGKKGVDARLRRMMKARQEFKRRQAGCIGAWLGLAPENSSMMLIQSVYASEADWKRISKMVQSNLDVDGARAVESQGSVVRIHRAQSASTYASFSL